MERANPHGTRTPLTMPNHRAIYQPALLLAEHVGRFFEFYGPRAEEVSRVARLKLIRGRRAGYRGWTRLPVERLPYLLEAARRAGIPKIVIAREAEAGAGPMIPRIPAAAGSGGEARWVEAGPVHEKLALECRRSADEMRPCRGLKAHSRTPGL